jgi:hypothetical protein
MRSLNNDISQQSNEKEPFVPFPPSHHHLHPKPKETPFPLELSFISSIKDQSRGMTDLEISIRGQNRAPFRGNFGAVGEILMSTSTTIPPKERERGGGSCVGGAEGKRLVGDDDGPGGG